jgi:hypothetical protein
VFEFEAAMSLDWILPGKPEASIKEKPKGNMLEPASALRRKVYIDEIITLWGLNTLPSASFGTGLDYNVRCLLDRHSHLPLEQHAPLICYRQKEQMDGGFHGWLCNSDRRKYRIPGWYIGERWLINLYREPETLPIHLVDEYATAVEEVVATDLKLWYTGADWQQVRKNLYFCRLMFLWHKFLGETYTPIFEPTYWLLRAHAENILDDWNKECLKREQVTGLWNALKLERVGA